MFTQTLNRSCGACVGMRGIEFKPVMNCMVKKLISLSGLKIYPLISKSLSPAEIQRVLIDQDKKN